MPPHGEIYDLGVDANSQNSEGNLSGVSGTFNVIDKSLIKTNDESIERTPKDSLPHPDSAATKAITPTTTTTTTLNESGSYEYEEILKLIGFGRIQWLTLFSCGLILMMVLNETMGMSIITIASQCEFATNSIDKAIMSAAAFIGILFSSYLWGFLSDTIGRRKVLIYTTFSGNILSVISMFMPTFWSFVVMRFLVGFCIAGASSTTYAYLGEFFTAYYRPIVINYASMFVGLSQVYVPAVAWGVLSMQWALEFTESFSFRPWRLLILMNMLPGFIATVVLLFMPETPKFYLSVNRDEEAYAVLDWICQKNSKGTTLSDMKVHKIKNEQFCASGKQENLLLTAKSNIIIKMIRDAMPLFKRPHVVNFLISCFIMCGLFMCSSGMGLWFSEIQNRVGQSDADSSLTICQVIDASVSEKVENNDDLECNDTITVKTYIDSITFGLIYSFGYVILGIIINPIGRKRLMIIHLTLGGICGLALLWIKQATAVVVCFCLFLVLPGLCISVLSGAVVDLVPTYLRGKAVCICMMLGRSGSVIGSNIIGGLLETNCVFTFSFFSVFAMACAALTLVLPI